MGRMAHLSARRTHKLPTQVGGFLLVNPRAGDNRPSGQELVEAARRRGIEAHVLQENEDPAEVARTAAAEAIGVAGGDGSLAAVTAVAIERDLPFVCIPFGTRNHFARDLGLDREDPIGALDAFRGRERRIDVGRADGRLFLNNVSLGLYARVVHRRTEHRRRRATLARLRAWLIVLTHREPLGITIDGRPNDTRLVLVANNRYDLELPTLVARERLELDEVVAGPLLPGLRVGPPRQAEDGTAVVRFEVEADEAVQLDLQSRLLPNLAAQRRDRVFLLVEESAREVPEARAGGEGSPAQQHAPVA